MKSEPDVFSIAHLAAQRVAGWDGVRNYQARLNLRAMKKGDPVCFYHSVTEKQIVGLARVVREAYSDPTATEGDWSCVDLEPVKPLKSPVPLDTIKTDPALKGMKLLKQSRLSVTSLTSEEFQRLLKLANP